MNGAKVFANKASIVTSSPMVDINIDEHGGQHVSDTWTGTQNTGMADVFRCNEWTNDAPVNGYEGTVGFGIQFWSGGSSNPCALKDSLYCFEQ